MLLRGKSAYTFIDPCSSTYLFIANGKLPLGLLVVLGKRLQVLYRRVLEHRDAEFDVRFGVFMARLCLLLGLAWSVSPSQTPQRERERG